MTLARIALAAFLLSGLQGCIARTAIDIATTPVKAAGKAVDLATTSQSEADERRGRELREREQRLGRLERERRELDERCGEGNDEACAERDAVDDEIARLSGGPPTGQLRQ